MSKKKLPKTQSVGNLTQRNPLKKQESINFSDLNYTYDFAPNITFFKFLTTHSSKKKLKVWVPDTIVYNDTQEPFWIYSNLQGEVCKLFSFSNNTILTAFGRGAEESQPVAILKKQCYNYKLDKVTGTTGSLLMPLDFHEELTEAQRKNRQKWCVQKFIKSSRPFICRTVFSKQRMPFCWVVAKEFPLQENENSTIFQAKSGKFFAETLEIMNRMVKFLEKHLCIEFSELVCDFVKDQGGLWWLLNVKAFELVSGPKLDLNCEGNSKSSKLAECKKSRKCEFCKVAYEKLSYQLTLKMVFEIEEHLKKRGKTVSWLENKEYKHMDEAVLYRNYYVCEVCFKLYTLTQELKSIEKKFAIAFNIPNKDKKPKTQSYHLEPEKALIVVKDSSTNESKFKFLNKTRMLIVLNRVSGLKSKVSVEYEFLGEVEKYFVDSTVQKLRLFYFFTKDRRTLKKFLESKESIKVKLLKGKQEIGSTRLCLKDFKSPFVVKKTYNQRMTPEGASLEASIGLVTQRKVRVDNLKLRHFGGVYIPPANYVSCDPIPHDWFEILPSIESLKPQLRIRSKTPLRTFRKNKSEGGLKKINVSKIWNLTVYVHSLVGISSFESSCTIKCSFLGEAKVFEGFKSSVKFTLKESLNSLRSTLDQNYIYFELTQSQLSGEGKVPVKYLLENKDIKQKVVIDFSTDIGLLNVKLKLIKSLARI